MTAATIIEAGQSHADLIAEMHRETVGDDWSAASVARLLGLPGAFALIAEAAGGGGGPVGAILCIPGGEGLEIASLGVLPAARRRGLARALLARALARCREMGASCLGLEVRADNRAARRLYESAGFAVEGRRKGYYSARGARPAADAVLMRRKIGDDSKE